MTTPIEPTTPRPRRSSAGRCEPAGEQLQRAQRARPDTLTPRPRRSSAGRCEPAGEQLQRARRARPDLDAVRTAVGEVLDPELPVLTIAMLGMVHDVRLDGRDVVVELLPTFAGCPATDVIAEDVRDAVSAVARVGEVAVRFRHDPAWTPDRISDEGHDALRSFGIAPPVPPAADRPDLPALPVLATGSHDQAATPRPCPYCGSTDTARDGLFGPTPCRDVRYCNACQQPFEAFKS